MDNIVTVKRENGEDIKIEIILSFKVEELNKQYIVYTINDDKTSAEVPILISEIDSNTQRIKSIPESQKDIVLKMYNEIKEKIINENWK